VINEFREVGGTGIREREFAKETEVLEENPPQCHLIHSKFH
jgi:hypothetical protein